MSNPAVLKKRSLILKKESTRGTFAAPANADFNIPFNTGVSFTMDIPITEGDYLSGDFDKFNGVVGTKSGTITASAPLWHSGDNDTPPDIAKLFDLCGQTQTINVATSVVWNRGSSILGESDLPYSAVIQDVFSDGTAYHTKFAGCLANGKIVGDELGRFFTFQVEIQGVFAGISDETELVLTGQDTTTPNPFLSATFTSFGDAQCITAFELDFGNQIELEQCQSTSSGFLAAVIYDRMPMISFNPKIDTLADVPTYTRWAAGTEGALAISSTNWAIAASKMQLITTTDAAQGNLIAYQHTARLNRVSGSVPYTITHT